MSTDEWAILLLLLLGPGFVWLLVWANRGGG